MDSTQFQYLVYGIAESNKADSLPTLEQWNYIKEALAGLPVGESGKCQFSSLTGHYGWMESHRKTIGSGFRSHYSFPPQN